MSPAVQQFIESFEHLPEPDKRTAAGEILRRSTYLDLPPPSDEELVLAAEAVFLELDRAEEQGI